MRDDKLPFLGLFLLAPVLAFALIAANALGQVAAATQRITSDELITEFAERASNAIEELQAERSNGAVVLLGEQDTGRQLYRERWPDIDQAIEALLETPSAQGRPGERFVSSQTETGVRASISDLDALRAQVLAETIALDDAVGRYTLIITAFTEAVVGEFERHGSENSTFADAFMALCQLHERIAIETGIGLLALANGRVGTAAHTLFIETGAPQAALASRFGMLAGAEWAQALSEVLAPGIGPDLDAARAAVIAGGYSLDHQVDQSSRTWWRESRLPVYFQLGALRSRYAQEGARREMDAARAARARAIRNAFFEILALFLASAASVYGMLRLVGSGDQASRA